VTASRFRIIAIISSRVPADVPSWTKVGGIEVIQACPKGADHCLVMELLCVGVPEVGINLEDKLLSANRILVNVPQLACMIFQHGFCWSAFPLREISGKLADSVDQIKEILKTVVCNFCEKARLKVGPNVLARVVTPVEEVFNQIILLFKGRLSAFAKLLHELQYVVPVLDFPQAMPKSRVPSSILHLHLL
jgi:hypothetical protein